MAGKYIGVRSTSEVPESCVYKELSHIGKNAGRIVEYWHIWVKAEGFIKPIFNENELQKDKIMALDKIFNNQKAKKYK